MYIERVRSAGSRPADFAPSAIRSALHEICSGVAQLSDAPVQQGCTGQMQHLRPERGEIHGHVRELTPEAKSIRSEAPGRRR